MKTLALVFPGTIIALNGFAQISFTDRVDTAVHRKNQYIDSLISSLEGVEGADREIDPYGFDVDLLAACVFYAINDDRAKHSRKRLTYNSKLEDIGWNYAQARSKYYFKNAGKGARRFLKDTRRLRQYFNPGYALWHATFSSEYALDYAGKRDFFRDKEETSSHQMVYGSYRDKQDSNYVADPVLPVTYANFARRAVTHHAKGRSRQESMSRYQSAMAVYVEVDEKTLGRNRMPMINVMIVYGANRFQPAR